MRDHRPADGRIDGWTEGWIEGWLYKERKDWEGVEGSIEGSIQFAGFLYAPEEKSDGTTDRTAMVWSTGMRQVVR